MHLLTVQMCIFHSASLYSASEHLAADPRGPSGKDRGRGHGLRSIVKVFRVHQQWPQLIFEGDKLVIERSWTLGFPVIRSVNCDLTYSLWPSLVRCMAHRFE